MIANLMLIPKQVSDCPEKQFLGAWLKYMTYNIGSYLGLGGTVHFLESTLRICIEVFFLKEFHIILPFPSNYFEFGHFWRIAAQKSVLGGNWPKMGEFKQILLKCQSYIKYIR